MGLNFQEAVMQRSILPQEAEAEFPLLEDSAKQAEM